MKNKKDNFVARATFYNLAEMTPTARREIAIWLKATAKFIERKGKDCSSRYTAKFYWT